MFFQTPSDLVAPLGIAAAVLLVLTIIAGVIGALKTFQVRQFQDLLFKAERKIDNLERRMFNVLNAVPVALVETDTTGKFTFANKAAHLLLGRKDSELIGLRFHAATWGIAYPDGRQVPPDLMPISRTLRGQTVKGFQHMLTNHSGHQKVLVSVTSMPIMNGMGEVIGATAALVEIENEPGVGVDDLTGLWRGHWFAAATVPFWGLDASGQILDINNAALDAFELKREQVLGRNWAQVFVEDADFQVAVDYLGDAQDTAQAKAAPNAPTSVRLKLKSGDGETRPALVTAWVVRTHEGGENGLTVMSMAAAGQDDLTVAPALAIAAPAVALSSDDAQELADFRAAESALAHLGVGTWQYDPEADIIVEDAGMQALIGRTEPGGPTLISEADQGMADTEFRRLMTGDSDNMAMDIRIVAKDGRERWITLKGQAVTSPEGKRDIFGVAFDCTEWKAASPLAWAEPVSDVAPAPEIDLDAVRQEARDQALETARAAHQAEMAALRERHETALSNAAASHATALSLAQAANVSATDAQTVGSDGNTRVRLDAALADLATASEASAALRTRLDIADERYDDLAQRYHLLAEAGDEAPAVPADSGAFETRIATLENQLADAERARLEAEARLDQTLNTPAPEPDYTVHDGRIAALEGQLAEAERARLEAQSRLDETLNTPAVAPDYSVHESRIAALEGQLAEAERARLDAQSRLDETLSTPAPQPDFSEHESRIDELQRRVEQANDRYDDLAQRYHLLANAPEKAPDPVPEPAPEPDYSAHEARIEAVTSALDTAQAERDGWKARYESLAAAPAPNTTGLENDLAAARFDLAKWQAAHRDLQTRLEQFTAQPTVDHHALEVRIDELQGALAQANEQQAELQARLDQVSAAHNHAQRFETVGRLTGDVAQDFSQMLSVINNALELMSRGADTPDNVRRLADAALQAGKRGERLTRQLQAFQSEEF